MAVIEARRLERRFRVAVKSPGLAGAMKHLVRPRYREVIALRPLDLRVAEGERVAYVGPNGAGKSTTLKPVAIACLPWLALPIAALGAIRTIEGLARTTPRAVPARGIA